MEPMKSKAPQLHLEYRFYKLLGSHGKENMRIYFHFHFLYKNNIFGMRDETTISKLENNKNTRLNPALDFRDKFRRSVFDRCRFK